MDSHQPEADQPTQASNPRIPITTAAGRWDGQPDLIGSAHSVNCLKQQIEVESTFHLDDGEPLRLAVLNSDRIAAVHLPHHAIARYLQELFHDRIKGRLKHG